jgi:hypothetical protein
MRNMDELLLQLVVTLHRFTSIVFTFKTVEMMMKEDHCFGGMKLMRGESFGILMSSKRIK